MNNLSPRQRFYGLLVLGTVALFALFYAFMSYTDAYSKRRAKVNSLTADLEDIERTKSDLRTQEANLHRKQEERNALNAKFDAEIARFVELRDAR